MLRLLRIELQKLLLNKISKTLILISLILPFSIVLLSSLKLNVFGFFTLELGALGVFNFPIIWHLTTFFASQFKFFFAIVVVSMIGNEYNNKTLKQNLIDGMSKKEFILSKFYAIVCFALISTVLIGLLSFCIGLYYSNNTQFNIVINGTSYVLAYFVKLISFLSLCLCLAILIKRSAFALAFLFILYILEWFIYWAAYIVFSTADTASNIKRFLPLESMYNLIEQPFQRIAFTQFPKTTELGYDYAVHWYELLIVVVWTAVFIFLSFILLKKRDL